MHRCVHACGLGRGAGAHTHTYVLTPHLLQSTDDSLEVMRSELQVLEEQLLREVASRATLREQANGIDTEIHTVTELQGDRRFALREELKA